MSVWQGWYVLESISEYGLLISYFILLHTYVCNICIAKSEINLLSVKKKRYRISLSKSKNDHNRITCEVPRWTNEI